MQAPQTTSQASKSLNNPKKTTKTKNPSNPPGNPGISGNLRNHTIYTRYRFNCLTYARRENEQVPPRVLGKPRVRGAAQGQGGQDWAGALLPAVRPRYVRPPRPLRRAGDPALPPGGPGPTDEEPGARRPALLPLPVPASS